MPKIDARHSDYAAHADQWGRCRDAAAGGDDVKKKGAAYLPRLSGQDTGEYDAYKKRADWYGATGRTIQGLNGAVFRRDPTITWPEAADDWLDDITRTGLSASQFAGQVLDELLEVGRGGAYVDLPKGEGGRPYLVQVQAEQIINWGTGRRNGAQVLEWVVLEESVPENENGDRYESKPVDQWRVLELVDGRYTVSVYRKADNPQNPDEAFVLVDEAIPLRRGSALEFVPFKFFNSGDNTPAVDKPPLVDLVDINLSHYRNSADLEHGRHYVGLPTPWVAGFPADTKLRIGSNIAWVASNPDAKAGILEFTGQGLGALEKALEQKQALMAVLGARLLEEQKSEAETFGTVQLRQAGEAASLQRMISSVEDGLTELLRIAAWWGGLIARVDSDQVGVQLNRDLAAIRATPQEIAAIVGAFQGGLMAFETAYYNLEQLEMTRPDIDAEAEQAAIREQEDDLLANRPGGAGDAERARGKVLEIVGNTE